MEVTGEKYVIRHKYKTSYSSPFHCRISCLNTMTLLLLNSHRLCQVPWAIHVASSKYSNMIWKKLHWNNSQDTLQKESLDIKNYKLGKHCSLSVTATSGVKVIKQTVVSIEHNLKYKWCKATKTQAVFKRQNCFSVYNKTVWITLKTFNVQFSPCFSLKQVYYCKHDCFPDLLLSIHNKKHFIRNL